MRKTTLLLLLLAGCATGPKAPTYGSFAPSASTADGKKVADDTVKQLVALYPPAITRFQLRHAAPDPFGTALVAALRLKGYSLREHEAVAPAHAGKSGKDSGHALSYVFDQPAGTDLYRVTLTVDSHNLSRVYLPGAGGMAPAGSWTRKE
jgi:hypothetical protein